MNCPDFAVNRAGSVLASRLRDVTKTCYTPVAAI
jgi:hypothetical protein